MTPRKYRKLETMRMRVRTEEGNVSVEVLKSPRGKPTEAFKEPYDEGKRWSLLSQLEAGTEPSPDITSLHQDVGKKLYEAIFPSSRERAHDILGAMQAAYRKSQKREQPLFFQLRFDPDSVMQAQLPWELLHDGEHHLVLDEDIYLNRYITYFGDRKPFTPVDPVRVLYVIARPTDASALSIHERDAMIEALEGVRQKSKAVIDVLDQATFENFKAQVQAGGYHIIHFDGHGNFDGEGLLCFETSDEKTDSVSAGRMADALKGSQVRLIVLSACRSSTVQGDSIFNSVAPALIRAEIPAVVGMQYTVPMNATTAFAEEFYASLARGESVSAAVADGRKRIAQDSPTWFFPTLYLRAAAGEGYLFSEEPEEHREECMQDLAQLTQEWASYSPELQAQFTEGPPLWMGVEVDIQIDLEVEIDLAIEEVGELATPPFIAHEPGLPDVIEIPEIGELVIVPRGAFLMGTTEEQADQICNELDQAFEKEVDKQAEIAPPEYKEQAKQGFRQARTPYVQNLKEIIRKEVPQHEVELPAFYISRQAIRMKQWWAFVQDGGYSTEAYWRPEAFKDLSESLRDEKKYWQDRIQKVKDVLEKDERFLSNEQMLKEEFFIQDEQMAETRASLQRHLQQTEEALGAWQEMFEGINSPQEDRLICPWTRWLALNQYWSLPLMETHWSPYSGSGGAAALGALSGQDLNPEPKPTVQYLLDQNPEVPLTWEEAYAFCMWVSKRYMTGEDAKGLYFSMPTEAEWEKASRGTDGRRYPWGEEWQEEIFHAKESEGSGASPYGLLGMCSLRDQHAQMAIAEVWPRELTSSLLKAYPYDLEDGREDMQEPGARVTRAHGNEKVMPADPVTCRCAGLRIAWNPNLTLALPQATMDIPKIVQSGFRFRVVTRSVEAVRKYADE